MALQQSYPIYDPFQATMPTAEHLPGVIDFERRCERLIKAVYERNKAAGRRGQDCFVACGIHRRKEGLWNYFNLARTMPKHDVYCNEVGATDYGGSMGHAEQLLEGEWRIATLEEEAACREKDKEKTAEKMRQRGQRAASVIAENMNAMAHAVLGAGAPMPHAEPAGKPAQKSVAK